MSNPVADALYLVQELGLFGAKQYAERPGERMEAIREILEDLDGKQPRTYLCRHLKRMLAASSTSEPSDGR